MKRVGAALVMGLGLASAGVVALASPAVLAAPAREPSFGELTAQAEAHRAAGRYAESAQAFARAYEALPEKDQRGLMGEITIGHALDDHRRAQEQEPESIGLLFQESALLERYGTRVGGLPEELGKELERVKARVAELHRAEEERKAEARLEEEERKAKERREAERLEAEAQRLEAPPTRRGADLAIVVSGVASIVGGAGLFGAGAWTFGAADDRRDEALAALEANTYPDEDGVRIELDRWHRQGRGIATGLTVSGAMLAGVGIGLASWGAVRLWRGGRASERRASVVVPMLSRDGVGLAAVVAF